MSLDEVEILLVEDNPADRKLTLRELGRHCLANRVHVAEDGEQALDFLFCRGAYAQRSSYAPRLVLLDLKLPKVDGLEVLREIRRDERTTMNQLPQSIPYGSIRIQFSGKPGSMVAEVSSVEHSKDLTAGKSRIRSSWPISAEG